MRARLSPEELAAIASAPPTSAPARLARHLGLSYHAVKWHLARFRRGLDLACILRLPPCTECGEVVVGPPTRITHPACVPARKARWVRAKRTRVAETAAPAVLAEQRARATARRKRHYHDAPEGQKALLVAEAHARLRRDYELTREVADSSGQRWTDDDDRYMLENLTLPARELALALGRTTFAVYQRRMKLRRARALRAQTDGSGATSSAPSLARIS